MLLEMGTRRLGVFILSTVLIINPHTASASDLADFSLDSSADTHLEEAAAPAERGHEDSFREPLVPNEPAAGDGRKFESLAAFNGEGAEDVEVFKQIPENGPRMMEMESRMHNMRLPRPPPMPAHRPFYDLVNERARHLASAVRQHNVFREQLGKPERSENLQNAVHIIEELQKNISVLEMSLELVKMAHHKAEEHKQVMLYDFVECQKRMSVSEHLEFESHRHMRKLNKSVAALREETSECQVAKNELEENVTTLEEQLFKSNFRLTTALKNLADLQRNMTAMTRETNLLRSQITKTIDSLSITRSSRKDKVEPRETTCISCEETLNNTISVNDLLRQELKECEKAMSHKPEPTSNKIATNNICENASIDAAYNLNGSSVVFFKGEYFWVQTSGWPAVSTEPQLISSTFVGAPGKVDAAFRKDDSVHLFSGKQHWRYQADGLLQGFPKLISESFPGVPDDLTAAYYWNQTGKIFFFKGDDYWMEEDGKFFKFAIPARWDPEDLYTDLPLDLDAVFEIDGNTIFIKDDLYYKYSGLSNEAEDAVPPYPRLSCTWLFGCPPSSGCAKRHAV